MIVGRIAREGHLGQVERKERIGPVEQVGQL